MTLHRTIDFREFDGLLVERAMADLGFDSRHVRVVEDLFEQGATVEDVVSRLEQQYPTWPNRANSLRRIALYLKAGRRAEE